MSSVLQQVAKVWYRVFWLFAVLSSAAATAGCVLAMRLPRYYSWADDFALTPTMLIFAATTLAYCLTLYLWFRRRNPALATFGIAMLLAFIASAGLDATNPVAYWAYAVLWFVDAFFLGMYGTVLSLGAVFLAIALSFFGTGNSLTISLHQIGLMVGSLAAILAGHLFWRTRFINQANAQLSQLTGILQTQEQQSAILIQSIADGVIVTNTDGKISLMNHTAANMTGWTIEDAAGIDVKQVFTVATEKGEEISQSEYPFTAVLIHKAFFNQVLQLTSRDGKKRIISLVISPVVTPKGEVYGAVAVLRDVSEQRAAEQQRAEFVSTASHEMRTPVAAIEGYLALALNDKVSTIDERARGYLEKAHASTQHLGKLFQDLLTSAKAEDGRLSSHPSVVEMGAFLEQLVEDLRFGARKKGINTEFIVGSSNAVDATNTGGEEGIKVLRPLYYVNVDPDRIREVITNLFDNGVKYTEKGKVSVGLTGNDNVVQIFVRDTGPGIPPDDVSHLFQKFYRVDNSATRTIGGTGLGLFIARKIIELYQGRIWVQSELGKGSTFFINLPRLTAQQAQDLSAATATLQSTQATPGTPPAQPAPATPQPQTQPTAPQQTTA